MPERSTSETVAHILAELGWVVSAAEVAVVLIGCIILLAATLRAIDLAAKTHRFDDLAFRPIRHTVKWVGILLIAALVLGKFGFHVFTALSTVLALIAVGFVAVWSVLSNFLCTFLLILFRPFKINDSIEFPTDNLSGRVVEMTTFATILEDPNGNHLHIPNNLFFQKVIKISRDGAGP
jgi:small-conductance mechanosensitive channel